MTRSEAYGKRNRAIKMALAYLRKSEGMLHSDLPQDPAYWDLLDSALNTAFEILRWLPDAFFETEKVEDFFNLGGGPMSMSLSDAPLERTEKIVNLLAERRGRAKRDRRIALLEQVEGRSPEEAAAYIAKARELRQIAAQRER